MRRPSLVMRVGVLLPLPKIIPPLVNSRQLEWTLNGIGFLLMLVIPLLFTPLRKQS